MAIVSYTATVKESRLLELPEEAQVLGLKPGDEVTVSLDRAVIGAAAIFPPNQGMLAALREIAARQQDRPFTDGTNTTRLLQEARGGAMYGYEPTE